MFSLDDLLGQEKGNEAVSQISNMLGANQTTTQNAIQLALPMILSGLAKNASQPDGAENLNQALAQDHNGALLENLGSLLGQNEPTRQTDGLGILGHIFGQKQGAAAQEVSQNTGLDVGQVAKLLITLAPIVMSYLGQKKQQENLDANGLSNLLQEKQQQIQSSGNPVMDLVSGFFDKNHDGSAMDDLASMAANYFTNR